MHIVQLIASFGGDRSNLVYKVQQTAREGLELTPNQTLAYSF